MVALFPYTAMNDDELSFGKGDYIIVVGHEDESWWKGMLNGRTGLFPSNYVESTGKFAGK